MGASLSTAYVPNWQHECASRFNCSSDGLVNIFGQAISCHANGSIQATPEIWGITFAACEEKCGMDMLIQSVDFSAAAIPLTTWLLPWLALIAQLPFEAKGWMNLLSACLAVGSPALAAYSLALTAFNRGHISRKFQRLKDLVENETHRQYRYMAERVEAAGFILQEVQQCPMRANQRTGELANLIVLNDPHRQYFWKIAAKDLKNTRRDFTYSFLAQVLMAFVTYLISFAAAVHDSLGSPDVGLQFASSSVWSWMFPIVFGYIRVGSQYKAGSIKEALEDNMIMPPDYPVSGDAQLMRQKALRPNADFYSPLSSEAPATPAVVNDADSNATPEVRAQRQIFLDRESDRLRIPNNHASTSQLRLPSLARDQDEDRDSELYALLPLAAGAQLGRSLPPPRWWAHDVRGDEMREGPMFNYARGFTWFAFAEHVEGGFKTSIERFQEMAAIPLTTEDAAACCGFAPREDLVAFAPYDKLPASAIRHMCYAALVAILLQWGTTGAAIYVAYSTPAIGLGCRSGSYLIYGIAATVSWLLLLFSNLVSHAFMQRFEENPNRRGMGFLGGLAVTTRLAGTTLAIANAAWLIASSAMEELGTFQTCWCQTDAIQYHDNGWTPVFKGQADLRDIASSVWIGGFLWSVAVCIVTAVIFSYNRH